jgi:hypothetical protein
MNKNYPGELNDAAITALAVGSSLLLISDSPQHLASDCENCGGSGIFVLFIATEGPYPSPSVRSDGRVSKWHEGSWYIGRNQTFSCPDCKGFGSRKQVFRQQEFS